MTLKAYQQQFLQLALDTGALQFGEFVLKSGRHAPYFVNIGRVADGRALSELGYCYAACAMDAGFEFDSLFGPAYKGIPIGTAMAVALARDFERVVPVTFDRKEAKDHGEGGVLIGSPVSQRTLIVDDVVTDGAAKLEAAELIRGAGGQLAGVVVALDRQERSKDGPRSAMAVLAERLAVPVRSIVTVTDLVLYLEQRGMAKERAAIEQYRQEFGAHS